MRLLTRNGSDFNERFPLIPAAFAGRRVYRPLFFRWRRGRVRLLIIGRALALRLASTVTSKSSPPFILGSRLTRLRPLSISSSDDTWADPDCCSFRCSRTAPLRLVLKAIAVSLLRSVVTRDVSTRREGLLSRKVLVGTEVPL